jgi:hypothetical protein
VESLQSLKWASKTPREFPGYLTTFKKLKNYLSGTPQTFSELQYLENLKRYLGRRAKV